MNVIRNVKRIMQSLKVDHQISGSALKPSRVSPGSEAGLNCTPHHKANERVGEHARRNPRRVLHDEAAQVEFESKT
jgi:hypothetical protein